MAIRFDASPRPDDDHAEASGWRSLPVRLGRWVRDVVSPEPSDVRRRRIESEAAAELGLTDQAREQVH
ncbi:MAG TPA: hypothetical protein VHF91_02550 [Acidimicrobiales bacterium]|nr:hypothetical protein [Acidimicrobiales bacterium]